MIIQSAGKTETIQDISDFYIDPIAMVIAPDNSKKRLVRFVGINDISDLVTLPIEINSSNFAKKVKNIGLFNFIGSNSAYNILSEYIDSVVRSNIVYENNNIGINNRGVFVSNNFVLSYKDKKINVKHITNREIVGNELLIY